MTTSNASRPLVDAGHVAGEFRDAGWSTSEDGAFITVSCRCDMGHITFVPKGLISEDFAREKLWWLFNESCYGSTNGVKLDED